MISEELNKTRRSALAMLSRREHSIMNLKQKLQRKAFSSENIQKVVQEMLDSNYLNEDRFVESWVYRRGQKGYGPVKIRAELLAQNVEESLIDAQLDENSARWFDSAIQQRCKRFGEVIPISTSMIVKQKRFLYQRGFNLDQIDHALSNLTDFEYLEN